LKIYLVKENDFESDLLLAVKRTFKEADDYLSWYIKREDKYNAIANLGYIQKKYGDFKTSYRLTIINEPSESIFGLFYHYWEYENNTSKSFRIEEYTIGSDSPNYHIQMNKMNL